MTQTSHRTQNYKIDHSTFGGIIYPADYNTNHANNGRSMASRIMSDLSFDEWCRQNAKNRDKEKQNKEKNQSKENL